MTYSKEEIIKKIEDYMKKRGGTYRDWYVGITDDAERRLFTEHNVDKDNGNWCRREAYTSDDAREVEKYFLDECGTDGGPGGGNDDSNFVYAYKKTNYTKE